MQRANAGEEEKQKNVPVRRGSAEALEPKAQVLRAHVTLVPLRRRRRSYLSVRSDRRLSIVCLQLNDPPVTKVTEREKTTPRRLSLENCSLAPLNSYLGSPASSRTRRRFNGAPASLPSPRGGRDRAAPLPVRRPRRRSSRPPPELGVRRYPLPGPPGFPRSGAEGAAGPEPWRPRRSQEAPQGGSGSARSYPPPPPPEVRVCDRRDRRAAPPARNPAPLHSQPLRLRRGWRGAARSRRPGALWGLSFAPAASLRRAVSRGL